MARGPRQQDWSSEFPDKTGGCQGKVQGLRGIWKQGIKHQMPHKTLGCHPPPLGLGSKGLKENVEQWSQQDQRHQAEPLNQAEREKVERQRQEAEQRKALLHRFSRRPREGQKGTWKEGIESWDYVRVSVRCFPLLCSVEDSLGSTCLLGEGRAPLPL
ncbi:putative protein FAM90A24P isoform X1 [Canis lupus familiaris]|uniref:putative protein FAM90A24P isoform X1 n=1 Tax=Canis lupus familiaris TaxID=9615 RepID=UPI0018F7DF97|nr:putative protein FAM90A24P isoform X1 [Canis lupus familiaris]